jgi:hypothetical protein
MCTYGQSSQNDQITMIYGYHLEQDHFQTLMNTSLGIAGADMTLVRMLLDHVHIEL